MEFNNGPKTSIEAFDFLAYCSNPVDGLLTDDESAGENPSVFPLSDGSSDMTSVL